MRLLEARDVSVTPPGAPDPSVRGVSLDLAPGEWLAVTGPNGGGKSSLLLGLAGLWPLTGEARLLGRPLAERDRLTRDGVAVVFQDPSSQLLQPTVYDEIAFGLRNAGRFEGDIDPIVRGLVAELGIEAPLDQDPATLSAGHQQMVVMAGALATGPSVLFADEATAHLDPERRRFVLERISRRARLGLGVVWVTQIEEEMAHADHVLRVGEVGPSVRVDPPSLAAGQADQPLLRLRVSPADAAEGPRVFTRNPLDIVVARTGVTALTGPNGVGKSVLLAAAAGIETANQVVVDWLDGPQQLAIAALQFPEQQIFEERVADEIAFAATSRGVDRDSALAGGRILLQRMGFHPEILEKRTWALSAGEKRLVEIAATLLAPASLYILDEPTAGLDPWRSATLAEVVREVACRTPVLVATQDSEWLTRLGAQVHRL